MLICKVGYTKISVAFQTNLLLNWGFLNIVTTWVGSCNNIIWYNFGTMMKTITGRFESSCEDSNTYLHWLSAIIITDLRVARIDAYINKDRKRISRIELNVTTFLSRANYVSHFHINSLPSSRHSYFSGCAKHVLCPQACKASTVNSLSLISSDRWSQVYNWHHMIKYLYTDLQVCINTSQDGAKILAFCRSVWPSLAKC